MSTLRSLAIEDNDANSYLSLSALRLVHSRLLKHASGGDTSSEFVVQVADFIRRAQATGAILESDPERKDAQRILNYWAAVLIRAGHEAPNALLADYDPTREPVPTDCPYPGLAAFGEADRDRFFGRERLVQGLIDSLRKSRLLVVVGPSGSGKSSAVLGGLLPSLRDGALPGSQTWHYYPRMAPGSDPLTNLAHLIQPANVDPAEWSKRQIEGFLDRKGHLFRQITEFVQVPVVLVVDQFEEVFTLCGNETARQAFITNLLALTLAPSPPHIVILTMRSDFESYIDHIHIPRLKQRYFEPAKVEVLPLSASELRTAIEQPADLIGLKYEEGLVDALIQDLRGEPAELPLLQFTLLKLWEDRERNRMTWAAYHRLEHGRHALARSADEFYERLDPDEQVTAERILLELVQIGEGAQFTSHRVRRASLYEDGEVPDQIDRVLAKLVDAQLVRLTDGATAYDAQVELAHETLIYHWPRLVGWLQEGRESRRQRQRLTAAAEQWDAHGRHPSALWRGLLLEDSLRYKDLEPLESAFVDASMDVFRKLIESEEAADLLELKRARVLIEAERQRAEEQQRRAEAERQRAEEQQRRAEAEQRYAAAQMQQAEVERKRAEEQQRQAEERALTAGRLRRLVGALVVALLLAGGFAIYAWGQQQLAQANQAAAESQATQAAVAQATGQAAQGAAATSIAIQRAAETQAAAALATARAAEGAGAQNAAIRSTAVARATSALATAEAAQIARATSVALRGTAEMQAQAAAENAQVSGAVALELQSRAEAAQMTAEVALSIQSVALATANAALATAQSAAEAQAAAETNAETARATAEAAQAAAATAQAAQAAAEASAAAAQGTAQAEAGQRAAAEATAQAEAEQRAAAEANAAAAQATADALRQTVEAFPPAPAPPPAPVEPPEPTPAPQAP
jgi:hypothetical protein